MHDRWVSKYAEAWVTSLSNLKQYLEEPVEKLFEIYIKISPERLWQAITDPEMRAKYTFGLQVHSDYSPGSNYQGQGPHGLITQGQNLEVDPPRKLVQSFNALWSEDGQS